MEDPGAAPTSTDGIASLERDHLPEHHSLGRGFVHNTAGGPSETNSVDWDSDGSNDSAENLDITVTEAYFDCDNPDDFLSDDPASIPDPVPDVEGETTERSQLNAVAFSGENAIMKGNVPNICNLFRLFLAAPSDSFAPQNVVAPRASDQVPCVCCGRILDLARQKLQIAAQRVRQSALEIQLATVQKKLDEKKLCKRTSIPNNATHKEPSVRTVAYLITSCVAAATDISSSSRKS